MPVKTAVNVCLAMLGDKNPVTESDVIEAVNNACKIYKLNDFQKEQVTTELTVKIDVWVGEGTYLQSNDGHQPWLSDKNAEIDWQYWNRYRRYLEADKGWSYAVTSRLNEITDRILGFLRDPQSAGPWDRRGMVVGEVQSGKTANYTGLICKAIDSEYKVIIVLAGLHNSLRSQTQLRLEQECVGRDTSEQKLKVGVGKYNFEPGTRPVHLFTSNHEAGDFNKTAAKTGFIEPGSDPVLMVIKKNVSVLNNVLMWAKQCGKEDPQTGQFSINDIPLLLIDDEADNASIDGRQARRDEYGNQLEDEDPTTINRKIRELLTIFRKSAYVGYTATPFANIFIYPTDADDESKYGKDLFPESFILNLHAPSNYIGPVQLFGLNTDETAGIQGRDMLPIVKGIDDHDEFIPNKHKKTHVPGSLPPSLQNAIRSFIITASVRNLRGQDKSHNSMLIHVTRFTDIQGHVRDLVAEEVDRIKNNLRYSKGTDRVRVINEFKKIWDTDYLVTSANMEESILPDWNKVEPILTIEASKIIIKTINGSVADILDYQNHPNGLKVIAVGGDKLSRGLTLEGLTVSYYLRASKMYDTLMQMGRWFGYRPGYLDLCRLYTSEELIKNYRYIALANEELRTEFDIMAARGQTPREYGLKVRTHPEGLQITATNKLRNGTSMKVSFSRSLAETSTFYKDAATNANNYGFGEKWLRSLGTPAADLVFKNYIWRNVKTDKVIEFLNGQKVHPLSRKADPSLLAQYIRKRKEVNELISWTVALINNSLAKDNQIIKLADLEVGLAKRGEVGEQAGSSARTGAEYTVRNRHLISERDERIDCLLGSAFYNCALQRTIENWNASTRKKNETPPNEPVGTFVRECRNPKHGLLIIYPLDPQKIIDGDEVAVPAVIGYAISFPKTEIEGNEAIEYKVATDYWRIHYGGEDDD